MSANGFFISSGMPGTVVPPGVVAPLVVAPVAVVLGTATVVAGTVGGLAVVAGAVVGLTVVAGGRLVEADSPQPASSKGMKQVAASRA